MAVKTRKLAISRCFRGFSLLEVTFVLLVMSVLLSSVLKITHSTQQSFQNKAAAERLLESVSQRMVAFYKANGFLPCPDVDGDGRENRNDANFCLDYKGGLPYRDLHLLNSTLQSEGAIQWVLHSDVMNSSESWTHIKKTPVKTHINQSVELCVDECQDKNLFVVGLLTLGFENCQQASELELENCDQDNRYFMPAYQSINADQFRHIINYVSPYELLDSFLDLGI